ncbi:transposase, partial [Thiolapillus sp.]
MPVARWRTGSRSSNWDCSPIAPAVPPCGRTNCGCTSLPSPMSCCMACVGWGLTGTAFAKAQSTTIRLKRLKIGARLRLTARKVWLSFSEAYSYASDIAQILANLKQHPAWSPP